MAISLGTEINANDASPGSTISTTITPSGTGSVLIVTAHSDLASVAGSFTGLAFAGTSLTRVRSDQVANNELCEIWYLVDPPNSLGTLNGTVSVANADISVEMAVYNGVDPTVTDANTGGTSSGSVVNGTLTTISDNSWVIFTHTKNDVNQTMSEPTAWVERIDSGVPNAFSYFMADNGPITPAGATTFTGTNTAIGGNGVYAFSMLAIIPTIVGGAAARLSTLTTLRVG